MRVKRPGELKPNNPTIGCPVTVSFELQNVSREDYERVYRVFSALRLHKEITISNNEKVLLQKNV